MKKDDAVPGTLVKFHISDRLMKAQVDEDIKRRAKALDGRISMIMERPFFIDKTRIRIQSVNDSTLTLGVKLKYLEIVRQNRDPPIIQNETVIDVDDEVVDGDASYQPSPTKTNQDIHVDLLVERRNFSEKLLEYQETREYLLKELSIADDEQYSAVLVNHINTTLLTKTTSGRVNSIIYRSHLGLYLLEMMEITLCSKLDNDDDWGLRNIESGTPTPMDYRFMLSLCIWSVYEWTSGTSSFFSDDDLYPVPSFFDILDLAKSKQDMFGKPFLKLLRKHFQKTTKEQSISVIESRLSIMKMLRFLQLMTWRYLEVMIENLEYRLDELRPRLAESEQIFYLTQLKAVKKLSVGDDSDLNRAFERTLVRSDSHYRNSNTFLMDRWIMLGDCRVTMSVISTAATKLDYYLSAGKFLVNLRDSENFEGKIALICDRIFLTPDWLRAIPRIVNRNDSVVSVRRF